jgi:hypothetical protein
LGRVVKVECHSGYTYAEKPVAIDLGSERFEVLEIISESRTPSGKKFQVLLKNGREIELDYDEDKDMWELTE